MRLCFLMERGNPPRLNPVFARVWTILEARGARLNVLYPEESLLRLDTLAVEADLYVLKSDTDLALSLGIALERLGARVLNRASASALVKDKVLATATLRQAGLPTPQSLVASRPAQLAAALAEGPLILKPHRGYHGLGIAVVEEPEQLPDDGRYRDLVFAQQYLQDACTDLKVLAVGDAVFGIRKRFSPESFARAGVPSPLSPEVEDIARRCGRAFGLELYGVDIAEDASGFWIVDVNYVPGYRGVPDAARLLAIHILEAARA